MGTFDIRVASIEETPSSYELESDAVWSEQAREFFADEGGEAPASIDARLTLSAYRIGRRLLFRGELEAILGLVCSWCVEPIAFPVRERVELLLEPSQNPDRALEGGILLDPEDIGLGQYTGDQLDFGGVILEMLSLAWPMQPRGSELCPERCPRWQRLQVQERASGGDKIRPFAGLDRLLEQSRRKAGGTDK
jgi:uncharacterized metal-binding protein YceD (DUF177 family)